VKDKYVCDVNDYFKYALLRELERTTSLSLAVAWMLTPDDLTNDGRRLNYLNQERLFRPLDPELFDELVAVAGSGDRRVAAIERAAILHGARFMSQIITPTQRQEYIDSVLASGHSEELIFFDPDNGFEVSSMRPGHRDCVKYLYWSDLRRTYECGRSVLVYQHFPRRPRIQFLRELAERARTEFPTHGVAAVSTPHTAFIAFSQRRHGDAVREALRQFAARAVKAGLGIAYHDLEYTPELTGRT
jgi:hypothetical protein